MKRIFWSSRNRRQGLHHHILLGLLGNAKAQDDGGDGSIAADGDSGGGNPPLIIDLAALENTSVDQEQGEEGTAPPSISSAPTPKPTPKPEANKNLSNPNSASGSKPSSGSESDFVMGNPAKDLEALNRPKPKSLSELAERAGEKYNETANLWVLKPQKDGMVSIVPPDSSKLDDAGNPQNCTGADVIGLLKATKQWPRSETGQRFLLNTLREEDPNEIAADILSGSFYADEFINSESVLGELKTNLNFEEKGDVIADTLEKLGRKPDDIILQAALDGLTLEELNDLANGVSGEGLTTSEYTKWISRRNLDSRSSRAVQQGIEEHRKQLADPVDVFASAFSEKYDTRPDEIESLISERAQKERETLTKMEVSFKAEDGATTRDELTEQRRMVGQLDRAQKDIENGRVPNNLAEILDLSKEDKNYRSVDNDYAQWLKANRKLEGFDQDYQRAVSEGDVKWLEKYSGETPILSDRGETAKSNAEEKANFLGNFSQKITKAKNTGTKIQEPIDTAFNLAKSGYAPVEWVEGIQDKTAENVKKRVDDMKTAIEEAREGSHRDMKTAGVTGAASDGKPYRTETAEAGKMLQKLANRVDEKSGGLFHNDLWKRMGEKSEERSKVEKQEQDTQKTRDDIIDNLNNSGKGFSQRRKRIHKT